MLRVSEDVMELVQLLNEEGYASLAGELLTEIGLGREPDDFNHEPDIDLGFGQSAGLAESEVNRVPLTPSEQKDFALTFLELRLVSPIRALAEAEQIAGKLAVPEGKAPPTDKAEEFGRPVRLSFRSPPGRSDVEIKRSDVPGSIAWADELSKAISSLRDQS